MRLRRSTARTGILSDQDAEQARQIAARIADALAYVGVLAVELFVVDDGGGRVLLVNEIAPRVHNSGHWTMDACAAAVPLGLFFGRIANFINGELWGRPTSLPWGMVFPNARAEYPEIEPTPRHPSQLYEAAFEGLLLFLLLRVLTHHRGGLQSPGLVTGMFLLGYGLARSFCELFRQFDPYHAFSVYGLTPGIVYSVP